MVSLVDGRGGSFSPSAHRQGRLRKTSTRTRPEGPQDWRGRGLQAWAEPLRTSPVTSVVVRHYRRSADRDRFQPHTLRPLRVIHGSGDTLIILTLYVDDILLTGKDPVLVDQKKRELKERFEMTDMGEVTRILGVEVKRDYDQGTLAITQTDYVENLLERFEMQNANVAHTP